MKCSYAKFDQNGPHVVPVSPFTFRCSFNSIINELVLEDYLVFRTEIIQITNLKIGALSLTMSLFRITRNYY